MKIKNYIKERRGLIVLYALNSLFCISIIFLDNGKLWGFQNFRYIIYGILIFSAIYFFIDFFILRARLIRISKNCVGEISDISNLYYPIDIAHAESINKLIEEYNNYYNKINEDSAEEIDFITKWIHDIKVPIAAMNLILDEKEDEDFAKMKMALTDVENGTQKVLYHIKLKSFYDDYQIVQTSTQKLIMDILSNFTIFLDNKDIMLTLEGDDKKILTDEKWSGYILAQILYNAIKNTPHSGKITISTIKNEEGVKITIKNSGAGIKEEDLKNIFNKGYTSSINRTKSKSTGYGLYLAKRLADKLEHKLIASSSYGQYAAFSLIFTNNELYMTKM